jgi:surface antigen
MEMRRLNQSTWGVILVAALTGCANPDSQQQTGMIVGGLLGGLVGSQMGHGSGRTTATILGSVIGASIGGNVGRSMDDNDRLKTAHALETVRTTVPSRWINPDTRNEYTVVPTRSYDSPSGPCREYTVDAVVAGRADKIYGTACRQPDGSWRTLN